MNKKLFAIYIITMIFVMLITGCNKKTLQNEGLANHKEVTEDSEYGKISMKFLRLDGENIRSFSAKKGKGYKFDYDYLITDGTITLQFRDSKDNIISEAILSDQEYIEEMEKLLEESDSVKIYFFGKTINVLSNDDKIKIAIIGDNASGELKLTW